MERFVGLIVAGGLALIAGLWLLALLEAGAVGWVLGLALTILGTGALGVGIASELELEPGR
ncbi:hypothetical protein C491_01402 [Natronococcus amylolyticus DSM 10524]|uniref:Uncharacterized protein n=1 Tax=Natronococcus amylolyticus DSM 10524 TaxID=1227497 RepID=L9XIN3_9EURY|nr:hypothetical protein [Natronococcus amylolyticus]ELY61472.1 hypothetical protein C491_01402 [Natronococcus amylolyticus DSM 10524]